MGQEGDRVRAILTGSFLAASMHRVGACVGISRFPMQHTPRRCSKGLLRRFAVDIRMGWLSVLALVDPKDEIAHMAEE